jgi:hypothetical protein
MPLGFRRHAGHTRHGLASDSGHEVLLARLDGLTVLSKEIETLGPFTLLSDFGVRSG